MAGKLKSRSGVNAIRPGPMVFLHGHTTGICFLADSGTAVSMIPGLTSTNTTLFISLTAANGAAITISEEMQLTAGAHCISYPSAFFKWTLMVLSSAVNLATSCLHSRNGRIFPGGQSFSLSSPVFSAIPSNIQPIISSFTDVCSSGTAMPPPVVQVQHFLQTEGLPVTSRFRRLDADKLRAAKEIIAAWERDGIVQRSSSQWSSPLHLVKKKDGS